MIDNNFDKAMEQAAAFQKIWTESITKGMQAAFTFSPNSPPSEILLQIRGGIFKALGQSWEEFMRSPQFLDGMRQFMEQAVTLRKASNDFLGKVRNEMQSPSREDIDTVMVTVHHMENRLLDRVEELSAQISELKEQLSGVSGRQPTASATGTAAKRRTTNERRTTTKSRK